MFEALGALQSLLQPFHPARESRPLHADKQAHEQARRAPGTLYTDGRAGQLGPALPSPALNGAQRGAPW